jgi:TonB family protein
VITGKGLAAGLACALAGHALVLSAALDPGSAVVAQRGSSGPAMQVRQVSVEPPPAVLPPSTGVVAPASPPVNTVAPAAAPVAAVTPPPPVATAPPAATLPDPSPDSTPQGDVRGFDYVPREFLSTVPKPLEGIEVPFPESIGGSDFKLSLQLSLFIDETGQVRRVRVDGPPLAPDLEEAARQAFAQARFTPGQVDGRAVRSLIRVEVTFESRPLDAGDPSR